MYNAINITDKQRSLGGKLVYPGESRLIEESEIAEALAKGFEVPGYVSQAAKAQPASALTVLDLTTELLMDKTVSDLKALLPELSDDQLLSLEGAEKTSDTPRETLLKLIEKEISTRENT